MRLIKPPSGVLLSRMFNTLKNYKFWSRMKVPVAKTVEHQHSYFGKIIKDDYHWLKDQNSSKRGEIIQYLEVKEYFKRLE